METKPASIITPQLLTQVTAILNKGGVHHPYCKELRQIAQLTEQEPHLCNEADYQSAAFRLMEVWEEITRGKFIEQVPRKADGWRVTYEFQHAARLEKSNFICEVARPIIPEVSVNDFDVDTDIGMDKWFAALGLDEKGIAAYNSYQKALSNVLFSDFERWEYSEYRVLHKQSGLYIDFYPENMVIGLLPDKHSDSCNAESLFHGNSITLNEFIALLDGRNRTSDRKIILHWTPNFVKMLLKKFL